MTTSHGRDAYGEQAAAAARAIQDVISRENYRPTRKASPKWEGPEDPRISHAENARDEEVTP